MLLSVEDLTVRIGRIEPLAGLSFTLDRGQILGLVGESGSGKSLTALAVTGLLHRIGGRVANGVVRFDGIDLAGLPERQLRAYRGRRIALITQNPMTALDPVVRVRLQARDGAGADHPPARPARARTWHGTSAHHP